jgi:hypothetical protein
VIDALALTAAAKQVENINAFFIFFRFFHLLQKTNSGLKPLSRIIDLCSLVAAACQCLQLRRTGPCSIGYAYIETESGNPVYLILGQVCTLLRQTNQRKAEKLKKNRAWWKQEGRPRGPACEKRIQKRLTAR